VDEDRVEAFRFGVLERPTEKLVEPSGADAKLRFDRLLLPWWVTGVAGFEVEKGGVGQHPWILPGVSDITGC